LFSEIDRCVLAIYILVFAFTSNYINLIFHEQKHNHLDQPWQAQDQPLEKVYFTFLGGLACDLNFPQSFKLHDYNFNVYYFLKRQIIMLPKGNLIGKILKNRYGG
jgi:hypothetical protein